MTWNELTEVIVTNQSFLISSHQSLDGDCVGSQLAFFWHLRSLGKDVQIYNHDPLPEKFSFLHDVRVIGQEVPQQKFDILLVLDCSNPNRLGWSNHDSVASGIINIDHHRDNTHFGQINIVNTNASATGEIIYDYFSHCSVFFPPHVAEALYMAILTDTGGFRFSNTNSRVLRTCADLCDRGANSAKIYEKVYTSHSPKALLLQSRIWSTLDFYLDGKICVMQMPLSLLDELGAAYSDSEGMADHTITASGIEVGMLIKYTPTETHFSLRSKGQIDVGKIAQKIPGGGGHKSAAGCTVDLPFGDAMKHMLDIIEKELC
jgi:bifunctional oligoribonuclease and PAP phosphatase NrnA